MLSLHSVVCKVLIVLCDTPKCLHAVLDSTGVGNIVAVFLDCPTKVKDLSICQPTTLEAYEKLPSTTLQIQSVMGRS